MIGKEQTLFIASANKGKIEEISTMLAPWFPRISSLREHPELVPPPEIHTTYHDNALQKALWALTTTGLPALADDSGIEIAALDNRPGVFSARFMGDSISDQERNTHILETLRNVPVPQRNARFVCVLVLMFDDKTWVASRGQIEGTIAFQPAGNNGFGYDPIFIPQGFQQTFAAMDHEMKNSMSHRGRAIRNLVTFLSTHPRAGS